MSAPARAARDAALYAGVRRTLIGGMALSFALMGLGLAGALLVPATAGRSGVVIALDRLPAALLALEPAAYLDAGVLVLMGIPAVHLGVALVTFLRQRERIYALAAGVVLALLAGSALLAFAGT